MKEIICPYCCNHFPPTMMVFRLKKSLREQISIESVKNYKESFNEEEELFEEDVFDERSRFPQIIDETYKKYLMDIEGDNEQTAEAKAGFEAEAIEINFPDMLEDIEEYDEDMYSRHKFVLELTYKGQKLTQRLCPFCHNELIPNAGLYDMNIIAMYGDTNVGKTVYLNVLRAVLEANSSLNGNIEAAFAASVYLEGNDEEIERHNADYDALLEMKKLPEATKSGEVVKPKILCYKYKTADKPNEIKGNLLIFRDIPGEDIRKKEKLKKYKFYLKNSDALIVLLDATKFSRISNLYQQQRDNAHRTLTVADALGKLSSMVASIRGDKRIKIPTAVVLAKADVFGDLTGKKKELFEKINIENSNNLHKGFVDREKIKEIDRLVKEMLRELEETTIIDNVNASFSKSRFFAVSALGETPKRKGSEQYVDYITPMRVAEPLYWILSELNFIPYFHYELWKSNKGKEVPIKKYYYENQRNGIIQNDLKEIRAKVLKKTLFTRWTMEKCNDSI